MKKILMAALAVLLALPAGAQTCSPTQFASGGACYSLQTLKAAILADPALNVYPNTPDGNFEIASAFNAPAVPACVAYQSNITPVMQRAAIFGPGAAQLDNLTQGKQGALLFAAQNTLDGRDQNIRSAFESFCGTQNTLKASFEAIFTRANVSRAEALYKSGGSCTPCANWNGSGACTNGSPAITTFEGVITYQIVEQARNLP